MTSKAKPTIVGESVGDKYNGWLWDGTQWVADDPSVVGDITDDKAERDPLKDGVPGVDYTELAPEVHAAFGTAYSGDGSPEHPHNVVPANTWHVHS